MKLLNPLILITLLFTIFSANADNTANEVKGEAIIVVDNKTYTLPLKKCYSATNVVDGNKHEFFVISTHNSRKSKEIGPRLSIITSRTDEKTEAIYSLQVDGGFSKGGTRYQGKMPYESFKDNKLVFEGKASSIRKEKNKPIKKLVQINITVSCN